MDLPIPQASPHNMICSFQNLSYGSRKRSLPLSSIPSYKQSEMSKNVSNLLEESRKLELIHRSLVSTNKATNKQVHLRLPALFRDESDDLEKSLVNQSTYFKPQVSIQNISLDFDKDPSDLNSRPITTIQKPQRQTSIEFKPEEIQLPANA